MLSITQSNQFLTSVHIQVGHTSEDVPVYAFGPSKDRFAGLLDNTDHAQVVLNILDADKNK